MDPCRLLSTSYPQRLCIRRKCAVSIATCAHVNINFPAITEQDFFLSTEYGSFSLNNSFYLKIGRDVLVETTLRRVSGKLAGIGKKFLSYQFSWR